MILGVAGIASINLYFFRNQRVNLIDQQIKGSTQDLVASAEFQNAARSLTAIDETITQVLGSDRIGRAFIVRDQNGQILFQSINVELLRTELPTTPELITVQAQQQYVRIQNTRLSDHRILQVGLVLDSNFVNWKIIDNKTLIFIFGLMGVVFLISAFLTLVLLSPIRLLSRHLQDATADLQNLRDATDLPESLLRYATGFWSRSDEFASLVSTTQKLINRINANYKLTRAWTLQMAHELKTPLAIIRAETESHSADLPRAFSTSIQDEIDHTSEIISQFIAWAELENSSAQNNLHVVRIQTMTNAVTARLDKLMPGRIVVTFGADYSVAANPNHLEQVLTNLLTNALKFSSDGSTARLDVLSNEIRITDQGPGIPRIVLERLGQPFNVGIGSGGSRGTGLGLAWVTTVAKLYGWQFDLTRLQDGTEARLRFPAIT